MRADCSLLSSGILYSRLQRVTIPDAVTIEVVLLKMGMLMLETCRGLSGILYSRLQRVTIPDAVTMQVVLLKMGMLMLETCRG
jgi:hypothetical protein